MEIFVWAMIISLGLLILMIPLGMAVAGLALLVNAIQKIFNIKS